MEISRGNEELLPRSEIGQQVFNLLSLALLLPWLQSRNETQLELRPVLAQQ